MRWVLSMVTTRRSSLMARTVRVLGTSTSMPDWRIGAVIMKMMSRTRTTSMNGTMLMSESEVCVCLASCGMFFVCRRPGWGGRANLAERFFDLRGDFHGKRVETLRKIANVLQKLIIKDQRGNGSKKPCGSGDESFSDAGCDRAKASGTRGAESGEGINDSPNGSEEADKGSDRGGGGHPGHAFFHAAHFFGGCKLHAYSD